MTETMNISAPSPALISSITFLTSSSGLVGSYPTNLSASHLVMLFVTTPMIATLTPSNSLIIYGSNTLSPSL